MDEPEIKPNRHVFVFIVGQEIKEKVTLKPPEASPLTISCVSITEYQIYIYIENVVIDNHPRVIFNSAVGYYSRRDVWLLFKAC